MEYVVEHFTPVQIAKAIAICRAYGTNGVVPKSSAILERYAGNRAGVDDNIESIDSFKETLDSLISITTETVPPGVDKHVGLVVDLAFDLAFVDVIRRLYFIVTREKLAGDDVRQIVNTLRTNAAQPFVSRIGSVFNAFPHSVAIGMVRPHVISAVTNGDGEPLVNEARGLSTAYATPMKKRGNEQGGLGSDGSVDKRVKMTEPSPAPETPPHAPLLAQRSLVSPAIVIAPPPDPTKMLHIAADLITSRVKCSATEAVVIASAVALAHVVYDIDVNMHVRSDNFHGDIRFDGMAAVFVLLYSPSAWNGIDKHGTYPIKCAESDGYLRGRLAREFYCAYVAAMAAHRHIDVSVPYESVLESDEERNARITKAIKLSGAAEKAGKIAQPWETMVDERGLNTRDRAVLTDSGVAAEQHRRERANAMHILTDPTRAVSWCRKQLERLEACIDATWQVYSPLSDLSRRFRRDLFDSARAEAIRLTFSRYSSIVAARTSSVDEEAMKQARNVFEQANMYAVAPAKAISDEIAFFGGTPVSDNPNLPINPIIQHMTTHPRSKPGGILETVKRPALFGTEPPERVSGDTQGIPVNLADARGTAVVEAADYAQIIAYSNGMLNPLVLCQDSAGNFAKVDRAVVIRSVHNKAAESVQVTFAPETPLSTPEQRMVVCTPVSTLGFYNHLQGIPDSDFRPGVRTGLMTQTKARMANVKDKKDQGDGVCKVM